MNEREMYLYECDDCALVFGVETAFEHQSEIVCPLCHADAAMKDLGCFMATMTREPDSETVQEPTCRVCGCTEYNACIGGCWWVEPDLCSQCVGEAVTG